jgi:hypothetical protein
MAYESYWEAGLREARALSETAAQTVFDRLTEGQRAIEPYVESVSAYFPSWDQIVGSAKAIKNVADLGVAMNLNQGPFAAGVAWGMSSKLVTDDMTAAKRRIINLVSSSGLARFLVYEEFYQGLVDGLIAELTEIPDLINLVRSGQLLSLLADALTEMTGTADRAFNFGTIIGEGMVGGGVDALENEDYAATARMIGEFLGPMLLELLIALVTLGASLAAQGTKLVARKLIVEFPAVAAKLLRGGKKLLGRIDGPLPARALVDSRVGQLSIADGPEGGLSLPDRSQGALSDATPALPPEKPAGPNAMEAVSELPAKAPDNPAKTSPTALDAMKELQTQRAADDRIKPETWPVPMASDRDPFAQAGVDHPNQIAEPQRALDKSPSDSERYAKPYKEISELDPNMEEILDSTAARAKQDQFDKKFAKFLDPKKPEAQAEAIAPDTNTLPDLNNGKPDEPAFSGAVESLPEELPLSENPFNSGTGEPDQSLRGTSDCERSIQGAAERGLDPKAEKLLLKDVIQLLGRGHIKSWRDVSVLDLKKLIAEGLISKFQYANAVYRKHTIKRYLNLNEIRKLIPGREINSWNDVTMGDLRVLMNDEKILPSHFSAVLRGSSKAHRQKFIELMESIIGKDFVMFRGSDDRIWFIPKRYIQDGNKTHMGHIGTSHKELISLAHDSMTVAEFREMSWAHTVPEDARSNTKRQAAQTEILDHSN